MTSPNNCVAYLRDSGGSEQDLSVDQQRAEVEKWCAAHGFVLTRVTAERDGNLVRGMIYFLNPNEEDIKKETSPGDEDSLPTCRCLHGASSHRQTFVITYTTAIKNTCALKHH